MKTDAWLMGHDHNLIICPTSLKKDSKSFLNIKLFFKIMVFSFYPNQLIDPNNLRIKT
jgi:hypothetical protein